MGLVGKSAITSGEYVGFIPSINTQVKVCVCEVEAEGRQPRKADKNM